MTDKMTIEVTKDFYDWWQSTRFIKDKTFMCIAWAAWEACRANYNTPLEPTNTTEPKSNTEQGGSVISLLGRL